MKHNKGNSKKKKKRKKNNQTPTFTVCSPKKQVAKEDLGTQQQCQPLAQHTTSQYMERKVDTFNTEQYHMSYFRLLDV